MKPSENTNVFVSYSHADSSLVAPVVKLLRINKSLVFQDIDGIQPGKRWRSEIAKALAESHLVVVFWCDHASRSNEVTKEWKIAIEQEKDLLPLLLDATPLPPQLSEFQWIDFRETVGANHSSLDSSASYNQHIPIPQSMPMEYEVNHNKPLSKSSARWLSFFTLLSLAFGIGLVLSLYTTFPVNKVKPPLSPPEPSETFDFVYGIPLLLGVVFAVIVCFVWLLRLINKTNKSSERIRTRKDTGISLEKVSRYPSEVELRIAKDIEIEILRRTALRRDCRA